MPARRSAKKAVPGVIRLLDASGSSSRGWDAAVADAVRTAREEVAAPLAVEVSRMWAELDRGRLATYRVTVKVAYRQSLAPPKATRAARRRRSA